MRVEPDVYALVLRLQPEQGAVPSEVYGHGVHGMFLELVRQVNPELANTLHERELSKHFTVALLRQPGVSRRRADMMLEVRVTLLRNDIFSSFAAALMQQMAFPALRLGRTSLLVTEVFGTAGSHPWAGYGSFAELVAAARPARRVGLHFATPTVTTRGTLGKGNKQRLNLFPLPDAVFGSLVRRWNDLAPPELALDREGVRAMCDEVLAVRYRLETMATRLRANVQVGFVGSCVYELPSDSEVQRTLALLADAAFYLGVGSKTTQGMGVCRREEVRDGA